MSSLFLDASGIPNQMGVYLVINPSSTTPEFIEPGTGGFFKGKDPNVSFDTLKSNWVEKTVVVYIGKAGAIGKDPTLRSRLKQYFSFGKGNNIGHYGGRLIWQLKNSSDLLIAWKPLTTEEPRIVEANLIQDFVSQYSNRPFANLSD